jgi:hypothetical protein
MANELGRLNPDRPEQRVADQFRNDLGLSSLPPGEAHDLANERDDLDLEKLVSGELEIGHGNGLARSAAPPEQVISAAKSGRLLRHAI